MTRRNTPAQDAILKRAEEIGTFDPGEIWHSNFRDAHFQKDMIWYPRPGVLRIAKRMGITTGRRNRHWLSDLNKAYFVEGKRPPERK